MNGLKWLVRFLIPAVVLYTIGYFVAGFSALTIGWIVLLSLMVIAGSWLVQRLIARDVSRWGQMIITFLVTTAVIFFTTFALEGGNVPLGGSLLAALIISLLSGLVPEEKVTRKQY
ncbi:hypothetical protein EDC14_100260 [Hydrogenispora ethanolica]|jgi:hypothetical protein|uniref:Superfamily IV 4 TMS phage holin n=1 Tax=Hydrogenispora ethanolica TaxID=1082276 RepID=A0A4V2QGL7_HYDET|nr:hypothetical protein [Hydrogenispora ethanolica]TCL76307.1 hypothetical protein EDC14_100260 [Hydrogenispora ethanolica]